MTHVQFIISVITDWQAKENEHVFHDMVNYPTKGMSGQILYPRFY